MSTNYASLLTSCTLKLPYCKTSGRSISTFSKAHIVSFRHEAGYFKGLNSIISTALTSTISKAHNCEYRPIIKINFFYETGAWKEVMLLGLLIRQQAYAQDGFFCRLYTASSIWGNEKV